MTCDSIDSFPLPVRWQSILQIIASVYVFVFYSVLSSFAWFASDTFATLTGSSWDLFMWLLHLSKDKYLLKSQSPGKLPFPRQFSPLCNHWSTMGSNELFKKSDQNLNSSTQLYILIQCKLKDCQLPKEMFWFITEKNTLQYIQGFSVWESTVTNGSTFFHSTYNFLTYYFLVYYRFFVWSVTHLFPHRNKSSMR